MPEHDRHEVQPASDQVDLLGAVVTHQGAPLVNINSVYIVKSGPGFIAAEIDMRSKWCVAGFTIGGPDGELGFGLVATDRSSNLQEGADLNLPTEITLTKFNSKEWDLFTVECSRYTVRIVLVQR